LSSSTTILIDDLSLSRHGRSPWPRSLLARLVRATAAQRPEAIGLDILLSEAEDAQADTDLAKAFREAGNVVLAAKVSGSPQRLWVDPLPLFLANSIGVGHVQAVEDTGGICRSVAGPSELDRPSRSAPRRGTPAGERSVFGRRVLADRGSTPVPEVRR